MSVHNIFSDYDSQRALLSSSSSSFHPHPKIVYKHHIIIENTCSNEAVFPNSDLIPVNSTVPSTSPLTTVEPILHKSPLYNVTGNDSPVTAD